MMIAAAIVAAVSGLFFSAFFSGAEMGLYCINRVRLHLGAQRREPAATRLTKLLQDEQGALSAMLVGTNLANFVTTTAVAYVFASALSVTETYSEISTIVLVTPIIFVFGEVVPKNIFQRHADTLMTTGSAFLVHYDRFLRRIGVVPLLNLLSRLFLKITGADVRESVALEPKRRVAMMLHEALVGSIHGEAQSDLIERVCRLSETPILAVMVPRNRVHALSADADPATLRRFARRHRFSFLPVYEKHPRRIIGVIRVDDLLQHDDWERTARRLRPAITLSPHETVASTMVKLQRAGQGLAVVVDGSGQMLGLVTLKDLISEVVGDLPAGV
jgi:CBS domain containing-hemolysin-like protein